MQILSKRIRELRQEQNMTQHELASMLHVHRATGAGYETVAGLLPRVAFHRL